MEQFLYTDERTDRQTDGRTRLHTIVPKPCEMVAGNTSRAQFRLLWLQWTPVKPVLVQLHVKPVDPTVMQIAPFRHGLGLQPVPAINKTAII